MTTLNKNAATVELIEKIIQYASQSPLVADLDVEKLVKFIRLYYGHCSIEDLEARTLENLFGAALSHWRLMYQRKPGELKVQILNPQFEQDGWQSHHTIVEIVTDDMPFLVDSLRIPLNTHLMIHMGGMQVVRDNNGVVLDVLAFSEKHPHAILESPLYLEIDKQTDPEILSKIQINVINVLNDVRLAVTDWEAIQHQVKNTMDVLSNQVKIHGEYKEIIAFLEWVLEDHFTFLGACVYKPLILDQSSRLGLLKDHKEQQKPYLGWEELADTANQMAAAKAIALSSKLTTRATVHRHSYTDLIGIKILDDHDQLIEIRLFIGLYTSSAYMGSPKVIPLVRKKVEAVIAQSKLPPRSHAGKDLLHILSTLPRDDLFHANTEELFTLSLSILHLQERARIRLFVREDANGRFVSCLVYVPRENFNEDLVRKIQGILKSELDGVEVTVSTQFSSSILVRIHYVVRVEPHNRKPYDLNQIEQKLIEAGQSWQDNLKPSVIRYFGEEQGSWILSRYRNAFPAGYRESFEPQSALFDIEQIEKLSSENPLVMSFYRPVGVSKEIIHFKLYSHGTTVTLSDALPILENMGLRVDTEQSYCITPKESEPVWINDFGMRYSREPEFEVEQVKGLFQQAFNKIWIGDVESDTFNRLVLEAQLSWREITLLRAYSRYFRQTGFTFSHEYIGQALVNNAFIARLLVELFHYRFVPQPIENRQDKLAQIEALVYKELDKVVSLDDDRILRRYLHIINATIRTNYFQTDAVGHAKNYLSFKFDVSKIPEMPLPLPMYEIFIYSARFEGIHLRAGKVARGGIRWSDRREDFRTEVLGLMKAQKVKNALIVPTGAKGGFVPKRLPLDGSREAILEEGINCYREYINGLLDLTDNLQDDQIVPPSECICYDDPDTYLVVAADKGTATFSDIANSIATEKNYWLGDAFASGGSTGYDHKKIGITARGAWVSARRQFQELGVNADTAEIVVVGIGDMSGDVFGNGMLQSPHIKLVAAFNHQHIFLDPDPNPKLSFEERTRLFNLPRSTWADYNRNIISNGGGVYSRSAKSISLSPQIKKVLGIDRDVLIPTELIRAILKSPVDLIWNGGIGTYVKSTQETNLDVGDRSNDALRVNGNEVRAKVICEGGNLGCTQLGRIEYELNGGKINTDFVDNSGGVDCSDHEVNIKILLNQVIAAGNMSENSRNILLAAMTDEVANLVLQNNYQQNRAISWLSAMSKNHLSLYINHISAQEQAGKINRELEFLPSNKELMQRKMDKLGITKPEMAILFAYSKITLKEQILLTDLPEDPYLSICLKEPFPLPLRKEYSDIMFQHKLRRDIIATQLCNRLVGDMGVSFVFQMQEETGASVPMIVRAYTAARIIFYMTEFYIDIESLDFKIDATIQYQINEEAVTLVRRAVRWLLRHRNKHIDIQEIIKDFADSVVYLFRRLPKYLLGDDRDGLESRRDRLIAANVPPEIALRVACAEPMYHALNIIEVALQEKREIQMVAEVYFLLVDRLKLIWFRQQINAYAGGDSYWVFLAKSSYKAELDILQRRLSSEVLREINVDSDISQQVDAWLERSQHLVDRWRNILSDLRTTGVKEFAIISVAIRELARLAQNSHSNHHSKRSIQ
ncbi:MAG: NAD-glutamate dehydrogenase [Proteobacteria bacterium]|nr:NAD-glutamate dehydrogenase [Pseudomonadota bacterium]